MTSAKKKKGNEMKNEMKKKCFCRQTFLIFSVALSFISHFLFPSFFLSHR